jgi:hypothetical protein
MGRPSKTLLERVVVGSFRADRYARLLDGELLPATSPVLRSAPAAALAATA